MPPAPTVPPTVDRRLPSGVKGLALLTTALTLLSRLPRLTTPDVLVFDEVFYAGDAADLLIEGVVQGRPAHPPLGTMMVAAGVRVFGFDSFGWRSVALLAGAVTVGITVLIAWRVTGSQRAGALAGLVVAADGIAFVTGRLALLDGLLALWTTAAVFVLVSAAARPADGPGHRRAAWLGSALIGAAMAVKWTAAPLVAVAAVTLVLLDLSVFAGRDAAMVRLRRRRLVGTLAISLLVPMAVYTAAHVPWLVQYEQTDRATATCGTSCDVLDRLDGLVQRHREVLDFHRDLRPDNRYVAGSASWFAQTRPTGLYVEDCDGAVAESTDGVCTPGQGGRRASVLAAGNPLVWMLGAGALPAALVIGSRRRQWPVVVVGASVLAFVVPWLLDRPAFSFYGAPVMPLLAVSIVWTVGLVEPRSRRRAAGVALGVLAVAGFVWSWPLLTAVPLPDGTADLLGSWPGWAPS